MLMMTRTTMAAITTLALCFSGCSSGTLNALNPFEERGPEYGVNDMSAILGTSSSGGESKTEADHARQALEVMGSYQRAQSAQPYNPVMNPAQVRLMWIPDHINKAGDLVPAHYYYLRVLPQTWAVQDAFDIERQLNVREKGGGGGAQPWVYSDVKR